MNLRPDETLFLAFIGALGLERLFELRLSARNARRQLGLGAIEPARGHYAVMAGFHTLFLVSCVAELLIYRPRPPLALAVIALAVALGAQALRYWAMSALGDRWNTRVIARPGDIPVSAGPYRFVRHPNYVAVGLELLAVPLIHGCWRTAVVFTIGNFAILAVRIPAEERALGLAYAAVFDGRPRFVPSSKGSRHG